MGSTWRCWTLLILIMAGSGSASAEILIAQAGPFSGPVAFSATELGRVAERAVADLNAAGGLLGQQVRIVRVDDYCDGEQAVAAAHKLVAQGFDFVLGHNCSGAAIPASTVYAEAGTIMMTYLATNPQLTERGLANVFRICGRDDAQGAMAGTYLADRWAEGNIAIVHDGSAYGQGLAEETRKALHAHATTETFLEQIDPDAVDYMDVVERLESANIDVVYFAGYAEEAALLLRGLREGGSHLQFVAGDAVFTEEFGLIAGEAGEGTLFTAYTDLRSDPRAADVLAALAADGYEPDTRALLAYGAVQAWSQAVAQAGSLDGDAVSAALHSGQFDTVVGRLDFDDKGDVSGYDPFAWYVLQGDDAVPVNLTD